MREAVNHHQDWPEKVASKLGDALLQQSGIEQTDAQVHAQEKLAQLQAEYRPPFGNDIVIPCMLEVAHQLNDHLASYDLVVGEDTSGRLPSLVYWRIVNARRRELGLQPAAIRFVSGRILGRLPQGEIPEASTESARTLIVSEFVANGTSVMRTYNSVGYYRPTSGVDIAAVSSKQSGLPIDSGSQFFYARETPDAGNAVQFLYGIEHRAAKGVAKDLYDPHSYRCAEFNSARVIQARRDVQTVAEAFYAMLPTPGLAIEQQTAILPAGLDV